MAKKKKKKKAHRFFWFMVKFQIFLMLLVIAGIVYYYYGGYAEQVQRLRIEAQGYVEKSDKKTFMPAQSCSIYDTHGNLISNKATDKEASYVIYEDIPAIYVAAIISIEDKKFYSHNGVDIQAVFRAAKAMIQNRKITQGGSTITMQLAKLIYLTPDQTWQYKIEQMFIASELEKKYSKQQILEFYLNNIYFANGYYGIKAACNGYFDCELEELDVSHVAFLLSIPNSPSYYDPLTNFENTMERRDLILDNMLEDGAITEEMYYEAKSEEIVLNLRQDEEQLWNNYVDTYAYRCATYDLMENQGFEFRNEFDSEKDEKEYNQAFDDMYAVCQKELYSQGYKIYTSIDMEKQNYLQAAVDYGLADFLGVDENGVYEMQGAAVSIDNRTGYVVAIVGGRNQNFGTYTLNRAYQSHRQPGSSIKPLIVYAPAFERGFLPESIINDYKFENGPKNYGDRYYGNVSIRFAVAQSLNTVAWQLYEQLTPEVGLQYLKNMKFSQILDTDYVLPTSLGGFTTGVSTLEMASAYATLENDGLYREPTCVISIIDSDENVIYASDRSEVVIYKETAARMMTDVMTSVMKEGTGRKWQLANMPSASKTGTTNDEKDGWFCGYTRYYTTAVWVGYDIPREIENLNSRSYAGVIWQAYMNAIHQGLAYLDFLPYAQLSEEFTNKQEDAAAAEALRKQQLQEQWNAQEAQTDTLTEEMTANENDTDTVIETPDEAVVPQEPVTPYDGEQQMDENNTGN